jgi:hypothetical protein
MYPLQQSGRVAALLMASAVAIAGCAPVRVNSFVTRGTDFTQYRTYAWDSTASQSTGDPRLDNSPFFYDRVRADVEEYMNAKGFERSEPAAADLSVHFHASVHQRIDMSNVDRQYGSCTDCGPFVYEAGTFVLDLVDTRTKEIVWRGWVESAMDGAIDDQKWMEDRVDTVIARVMEKLPPRLAASSVSPAGN